MEFFPQFWQDFAKTATREHFCVYVYLCKPNQQSSQTSHRSWLGTLAKVLSMLTYIYSLWTSTSTILCIYSLLHVYILLHVIGLCGIHIHSLGGTFMSHYPLPGPIHPPHGRRTTITTTRRQHRHRKGQQPRCLKWKEWPPHQNACQPCPQHVQWITACATGSWLDLFNLGG